MLGLIGGSYILMLIVGGSFLYNLFAGNLSKVWPIIDLLQFCSFMIYLNSDLPFNIKQFFKMFSLTFTFVDFEKLVHVDLST